MPAQLEIRDLHTSIDAKPILKGVSMTVNTGEIHAVMGPNGSGKSTLAYTIMGHPRYKVDKGNILIDGESILGLTPDQRARKGLFLAFQYPLEVSGVPLFHFLRTAYRSLRDDGKKDETRAQELVGVLQFKRGLQDQLKLLEFDDAFMNRYVNEGFSGGEKKRAEVLQMAVLKPKIAVLDETDSGLDIDSVQTVSKVVNGMSGPDLGVLLITHYQRILRYIRPQFVHVLIDGRIVRSGTEQLAEELEARGYDWLEKEALGAAAAA